MTPEASLPGSRESAAHDQRSCAITRSLTRPRISNGPAWRVPAGNRSLRRAPSAPLAPANSVRVLLRATPVRSETPTAAAVQHARPSRAAEAPDNSGRGLEESVLGRTLAARPSTDRSSSGRRAIHRRRSPNTRERKRRHSQARWARSRRAFRGWPRTAVVPRVETRSRCAPGPELAQPSPSQARTQSEIASRSPPPVQSE